MTPERSSSKPTLEDLFKTYGSDLPGWFHRLGLSNEQAKDATQTLWLIVAENIETIPANPSDTKRELSRLVSNIAKKTKRHALLDDDRRGAKIPADLPGKNLDAEQMAFVNELLDAIDALPGHLRDVFIAHKILGLSAPEISAMTGLGEDIILVRVWNACALIRKKFGLPEQRKEKRGVVIAPADIEIPVETRAVFCVFWTIKGTMPSFGGPKDPPPPPPPIPWFANAAPIIDATRRVTLKVNQTILLLLLMFTSAGTVALIWLWEPGKVGTAQSGLRVPPAPAVGAVNDVVDAYPAQAPAAHSARAEAPKNTQKPTQALDDDALQELEGPGLTRSGSGSD